MRKSNRYMFDVGRKAVEYELHQSKIEITRDNCYELINSHFEKSGEE